MYALTRTRGCTRRTTERLLQACLPRSANLKREDQANKIEFQRQLRHPVTPPLAKAAVKTKKDMMMMMMMMMMTMMTMLTTMVMLTPGSIPLP